MQISNKLFGRKGRQMDKTKWKVSLREINSRKAIISSLNSFDKKKLLISILVMKKLEFKAQDISIAMISVNVYCVISSYKKAQVVILSMRDIQHQYEKEARAKINLKSVVS